MITQYDLYETPSPKGEDGKKSLPDVHAHRCIPVKPIGR